MIETLIASGEIIRMSIGRSLYADLNPERARWVGITSASRGRLYGRGATVAEAFDDALRSEPSDPQPPHDWPADERERVKITPGKMPG